MGQRITRAKGKIKAARIPYRVPSSDDLPARLSGVLAVLFLIFNEGYLASDPEKDAVRSDLTLEAIRLTRLLQALLPSDGEVAGLLALMLLTEARRSARVSASGELVTLDEQDRGAWDAALIAEGHALVRERIAAVSAGQGHAGRYQILAAINAVHTSVRDVRDTDWSQIVALYDRLAAIDPSPIVALNRAVALAELDGPEVALAVVDRLDPSTDSDTAWAATTPTTPPGPTCYAGSAAPGMPVRRTRGPSSWQATPPRSRTSLAGATSSGPIETVAGTKWRAADAPGQIGAACPRESVQVNGGWVGR